MRVRRRKLRTMLAALAVVLPGRLRRVVLVRLLGHEIAPSAYLGRSFVNVDHLSLAPGAVLKHFCVIRGCEEVVLGADATVGNFNIITAQPRRRSQLPAEERHPVLVMGSMAILTTMHVVDCSDRVELAEQAGITGCWSTVLTRGHDPRSASDTTAPIYIGRGSFVGARCALMPGSVVGERCIVAAASTVLGALDGDSKMFGGTPARVIKDLDPKSAFFRRKTNVLL